MEILYKSWALRKAEQYDSNKKGVETPFARFILKGFRISLFLETIFETLTQSMHQIQANGQSNSMKTSKTDQLKYSSINFILETSRTVWRWDF